MKKLYFLSSMFALLLIIGCNKEENSKFIINDYYKTPIDLYEKIELISLETSENSLVGSINKIVITESKIYILDETQKTVFIFSHKGDFISKINNFGGGAGEYARLLDFNLTPDGGIELLEGTKIMQYDKENNFLKSITLPAVSHFFLRLDSENIVLYHLFEEKRVSIFNTKTLEHVFYGKENPSYSSMLPINPYFSPFFKTEGRAYFNSTFTNDIFEIKKGGMKKKYTFFSDYPLDFSNLPDKEDMKFYLNYYKGISSPLVINSFCCKKYRFAYFDINSKEELCIFLEKLGGRGESYYINSFYGAFYKGIFFSDTMIYGFIKKEELLEYKKSPIRDIIVPADIDNFVSSLEDDANPVIIKYHLKK